MLTTVKMILKIIPHLTLPNVHSELPGKPLYFVGIFIYG